MDEPTIDPVADLVVDGNAVAGALTTVFRADVTVVPGRCAHCGAVNAVGALRAYVQAPGAVLRCPSCDGVVLRVVETAEATYIDARGAAYLRFDRVSS
jgi:phage FluMu protein Com